MKNQPFEERFWSKVKKGLPNECWEWVGQIDHGGYGIFSVLHRNKKAHRIAWELANGAIPNGMLACHKCDNRKCVNPSHLFLGSTQDNIRDRDAKSRQARGIRNGAYTRPDRRPRGDNHGLNKNPHRRPFGSRNGLSKLTEDQVKEIKILLQQGLSQASLARKFGVQRGCICKIAKGRTWNHVEAGI